MKLLMRSWAGIDPLSALNYAENSLDEKSEEDLPCLKYLQDGRKEILISNCMGENNFNNKTRFKRE